MLIFLQNMKTRRSIRLQCTNDYLPMQSVLFPEPQTRNKKSIVPETPVKYNKTSNTVSLVSVLETPDITETSNDLANQSCLQLVSRKGKGSGKIALSNLNKSSSSSSDEFSALDITPDLNLKKKKGIISILESEFSFSKSLKTNKSKNSSMLSNHMPNQGNILKRNNAKSFLDRILPSDLNNEKLLAVKLCLSPISNAVNGNKPIYGGSPSSKIINKRKKNSDDKSFETPIESRLPLRVRGSRRSMILRQSIVQPEGTIFYENNDLDFTIPSSGSKVILRESNIGTTGTSHFKTKEQLLIPKLNISSSSCNSEILEPQVLSICNISANGLNDYLKNAPNKTALNQSCLGLTGSPRPAFGSPITNLDVSIGELNNLNRSIFLSQGSVSPTQPACYLILQGVTALVDVRSGAENRSLPIEDVLLSFGAKVVQKFSTDVSHLIFRNGSKSTYKRALQRRIHIVSSLWVDACKVKEVRVSESLFQVSTESDKISVVKRHRKLRSMQPRTFEEDKQLITNRLRKRLQSTKASTSSDASAPSTPILRNIAHNRTVGSRTVGRRTFGRRHLVERTFGRTDIWSNGHLVERTFGRMKTDSPLFGIEHLLTPNRLGNMTSSSQSSSENDGSDKEFNTPLAQRMYNRIMSPFEGVHCNHLRKDTQCMTESPLANQVAKENSNPQMNSSNSDPFSSPSISPMHLRRRSVRLRSSVLSPYASNKVSETTLESNCSTSLDTNCTLKRKVTEKPEITSSPDNVAKEVTKSYRTRKSILKDPISNSIKNKSSRLCVTYKDLSEVIPNLQEQGNIALSSTSSQTSISASSGSKRHKLHSVESDVISQDLIIPSTPDKNLKVTNFPYDDLCIQESTTQRNEMKIYRKKEYADLKVLPLPRKIKKISPANKGPACSNPNLATASGKSLLIKNDKARKARFSLIPNKRNSLEEFESPRITRRNSCFDFKSTNKKSLPSICITSVHSSEMGSLHAIIKSLGEFKIVEEVEKCTTHIVCGLERRTMNVLFGIASGCWVVDISWLYESVELLKWAPEEPFEIFNYCPGSQITRQKKENGNNSPLFHDFGGIYIHKCSPKIYVMKNLLLKCGAKIASTSVSADLIISDQIVEGPSCAQVTEKWAFDSIQHWQVKDLDEYLISVT